MTYPLPRKFDHRGLVGSARDDRRPLILRGTLGTCQELVLMHYETFPILRGSNLLKLHNRAKKTFYDNYPPGDRWKGYVRRVFTHIPSHVKITPRWE